VVRLGFIIGLLALIGTLLSGLAAYRVHEQELAIEGIALARAIDVHASLVQDRLTERELLARVSSGLFRAPSVVRANMLQPLRSAIYAFKTDFVVASWIARLKPEELDAASKELAAAGFPNPTIRRINGKPIDSHTIGKPIDVLMDLEPRNAETRSLAGSGESGDSKGERFAREEGEARPGLLRGLVLGAPLPDRSLDHLAAAQAAGADPDPAHAAVDHRADPLEVGLPGARRDVVGVADIAAEGRPLAAELALLGHVDSLLATSPKGR